MNENKNITYQNLWDAAKSVLRGKFTAVNVYIWKEERSQTNTLTFYLKLLERENQTKPKASRRKEIIKTKVEVNELENRQKIEKINKTKSWRIKEELTPILHKPFQKNRR